ncbi:HEAT repeat domain-containing protein [Kibdelosporangium lantanae]|uniref:HEAT repeat domain-containing protein n=1 Tax=Kibdelosporangium lantanae TaxID=1497396 RepID=A0ABW3M3P4_9PSEU
MTGDHRTVLAPAVTREQFQDLALLNEWRIYNIIGPSADQPYEQIWSVDEGSSAVHYVEDDRIGVASVVTMGERAAELAALVRQGLTTLSPSEVLVWVYALGEEGDPGERVRALGYLAAVAPDEPVDAFVAVLEEALGDHRPEVRRAALYACVYLSWAEAVPLVEAARDNDSDEAVRTYATQVLDAIRRYT